MCVNICHFSVCHCVLSSVSLQALSEIESEDLVQEERARKAAVRKSKMDADLDAESADLQEKKGVSFREWYLDDHYLMFSVCVLFCPIMVIKLAIT